MRYAVKWYYRLANGAWGYVSAANYSLAVGAVRSAYGAPVYVGRA